jgi:hypothetical protein
MSTNPEVTAKPDEPRKKYQKQPFAVPRGMQPSDDKYDRCSTISVNLRYLIREFPLDHLLITGDPLRAVHCNCCGSMSLKAISNIKLGTVSFFTF